MNDAILLLAAYHRLFEWKHLSGWAGITILNRVIVERIMAELGADATLLVMNIGMGWGTALIQSIPLSIIIWMFSRFMYPESVSICAGNLTDILLNPFNSRLQFLVIIRRSRSLDRDHNPVCRIRGNLHVISRCKSSPGLPHHPRFRFTRADTNFFGSSIAVVGVPSTLSRPTLACVVSPSPL